MKTSKMLIGFACLICFILLASLRSNAQDAPGFTTITYDDSTNTVTAYSETDTDYYIDGDYEAHVYLGVYDDSGTLLYDAAATDTVDDGYVSVTIQFTPSDGATYTARGKHILYAINNDYDDVYPYEQFWYDDWDFSYFTSQYIDVPLEYDFESPGYFQKTIHSPGVYLGETDDFASLTVGGAYPVNFHLDQYYDEGNGNLHFFYKFDSSTGNLNDLSRCLVGEIVYYPTSEKRYNWPPPFPPVYSDNPTVNGITGKYGLIEDYQLSNSGYGFRKPYFNNSFLAQQRFRYKCPGVNHGNWVYLTDWTDIIRAIYKDDYSGIWKYEARKSGYAASMQLP